MDFNKGVLCVMAHNVALPFTLITKYLIKAKEEEELWKLKYFTMQKTL
jgi:hypothetical protein